MTKKGQKALASATILSLVLTTALATGFTKNDVQAASVKRQGGADRIGTAVDVAKAFEKAENVVLVNGYGYADAVSATPLAKQLNAPILLTNRDGSLPTNVTNTIKDLGAKNVYIVGGTGVVSKATEDGLKDYKVVRIAGKADTTRFGTNAAVAEKVLELSKAKKAILVNGQDGYADALSVASIAAKLGYPVLFSKSTEVPSAVKNVIDAKELGILAVGGEGVLPEKVVKTVKGEKITKAEDSKDRFATNLAVLKYFEKDLDFANVYVAAGGSGSLKEAFADALVASAAAAKTGAPLVLTGLGANDTQKANANSYIKSNIKDDATINIVGGTGSVDAKIEDALKDVAGEGKVDLKEIKKVEVTSTLVDFKEDGTQKLEMKVNGGKVTVEDLDKAGYDVEFQADEDVFENEDKVENEGTTSNTGELDKAKLEKLYKDKGADEDEDFSYKVVIKQNGSIIAESKEIDVDIINGESTANKINEYTLKLVRNADDTQVTGDLPKVESGKLIAGETIEVTDVKADTVDGKKNADITNDVTLETSDPFVATVSGREVKAEAEGTVDITIKSGSYKKKVTLKVYKNNDENKRKINKVEADTSSIKLAKGGSMSVELKFLDQYGDSVKGAVADTDFTIKTPIKDSNDNEIATVKVKDGNETDKKGKLNITVTADKVKVGKADLEIKKENGAKVRTIPVEVTADAVFNKAEFKEKDSDSKDFKLDINAEAADDNSDDVVKLELNQYTKNRSLIGPAQKIDNNTVKVDGKPYTIKAEKGNKEIIPTKIDIDNDGTIEVSLDRDAILKNVQSTKDYVDEGYVTIVAKEGNLTKDSQKINIKDSSPRANKVVFKSNVEANSDVLPIDSIIDLDKDMVIKNDAIKIDGAGGDGKIRINEDGIVYIDTNIEDKNDKEADKGVFDAYDIYLGKLTAARKSGDVVVKGIKDGKFQFAKDKDKDIDGTVTIGFIKAHDKTPFRTEEVKVKASEASSVKPEVKPEVKAATDAVVKAEASKTQVDVDAAKKLVEALPAGAEKDALVKRVDAIKVNGDKVEDKVVAEVINTEKNTPVMGRTAIYVKVEGIKDLSKCEVTVKGKKATLQSDGTFAVVLKGIYEKSDFQASDIVVK